MTVYRFMRNVVVVFTLLAAQVTYAKPTTLDSDKISIVVASCDKYSNLWPVLFAALEKNWPTLNTSEKSVKIYLIANKKKYTHPRIEMINIPQEKSWSDNMLEALEKVHTKYILLFLDDFWIIEPIKHQRLVELVSGVQQSDAAYLELHYDDNSQNKKAMHNSITNVYYKNKFQNFRAPLQLSIWETKALKQLLRSGESAWDFEIAGSIRSSGYPKEFLGIKHDLPIKYINASFQGHIRKNALKLAKQYDPNFVNTMPVLKKYNSGLMFKYTEQNLSKLATIIKAKYLSKTESYHYLFEDRT